MDLDPRKFAISPSISLVNQIGGAFHATSCRNLLSIVERGILPGAAIEEDYSFKVRGRKASHLLWHLCSMGLAEHHYKTKGFRKRKAGECR